MVDKKTHLTMHFRVSKKKHPQLFNHLKNRIDAGEGHAEIMRGMAEDSLLLKSLVPQLHDSHRLFIEKIFSDSVITNALIERGHIAIPERNHLSEEQNKRFVVANTEEFATTQNNHLSRDSNKRPFNQSPSTNEERQQSSPPGPRQNKTADVRVTKTGSASMATLLAARGM